MYILGIESEVYHSAMSRTLEYIHAGFARVCRNSKACAYEIHVECERWRILFSMATCLAMLEVLLAINSKDDLRKAFPYCLVTI